MDSPTITLYRFASAGVVVAMLLWRKGQLPRFLGLPVLVRWLSVVATLMLVINYNRF